MFGPVLACRTFKTEEEAVAIANDSEYGMLLLTSEKGREILN